MIIIESVQLENIEFSQNYLHDGAGLGGAVRLGEVSGAVGEDA
jgi:hypothetical protein